MTLRGLRGLVALAIVATLVDSKTANDLPETVYVKELEDKLSQRSSSDLPETLKLEFDVSGESVHLNLRRNRNNYLNAPVTFENPKTAVPVPKLRDIGLYQDMGTGAAITVTTTSEKQTGRRAHKLNGSFKLRDQRYEIKPDEAVNPDSDALHPSRLSGSRKNMNTVAHTVRKSAKEGETAFKVPDEKKGMHDFKVAPEDVFDGPSTTTGSTTGSTSKTRTKRETLIESYHVEILFVIDHSIWEFWLLDASGDQSVALERLLNHFAHQMNGIDLAYKTIAPLTWGYKITPWLVGYHIAQSQADSYWTVNSITQVGSGYGSTAVDGDSMLSLLGEWSVSASEGRSWKNPDHTMLWTKYDIFGNGVAGYAYVGGVCKPEVAVSIQEDHGLHVWTVAAHELGHNLGSNHDGDGNSCSSSDHFMMAASGGLLSETTIDNTFVFSPCSMSYFGNVISGNYDGYPRVCLTNNVCEHAEDHKDVDALPGLLYSPDEQCQLHYGETSYKCLNNGEDICMVMYCYRAYKDVFNCWSNQSPGAADGTTCDLAGKKWCMRGRCVTKDDNPAPQATSQNSCTGTGLPTTVPEGCTDTDNWIGTVNGEPTTCDGIVTKYPQFCFTWPWAKAGCCATCHSNGLVQPTQHVIDIDIIDEQVECAAGTYLSGGSCVECAKGYYQNLVGSTSCKKCRRRYTTPGTGSTSSSDCFRCQNVISGKKCKRHKRKGYCTSNKSKTNTLTWAEYMAIRCKMTCGLC